MSQVKGNQFFLTANYSKQIHRILQEQSDLGLHCLSRLFWQATYIYSVQYFRTSSIPCNVRTSTYTVCQGIFVRPQAFKILEDRLYLVMLEHLPILFV